MYFIEGTQCSFLIDTSMGEGELKIFVSSITDKPILLVLTHAHWDHIKQAHQFDESILTIKTKNQNCSS